MRFIIICILIESPLVFQVTNTNVDEICKHWKQNWKLNIKTQWWITSGFISNAPYGQLTLWGTVTFEASFVFLEPLAKVVTHLNSKDAKSLRLLHMRQMAYQIRVWHIETHHQQIVGNYSSTNETCSSILPLWWVCPLEPSLSPGLDLLSFSGCPNSLLWFWVVFGIFARQHAVLRHVELSSLPDSFQLTTTNQKF